jgi:hypothetical protein
MTVASDVTLQRYIQHGDWQQPEFVGVGEIVFTAIFSAELIIKFVRYRWHFFYNTDWKSNLTCITLVGLSYFFLFSGAAPSVAWLRMVRILRVAKAMRVLRLAVEFQTLRTILEAIVNSGSALIWSVLLICLIAYMFSLIFAMRVFSFLQGNAASVDIEVEQKLLEAFGSIGSAMMSLIVISTGDGNWHDLFYLLAHTGPFNQAALLLFVAFSQIALWNIILGIFVDAAMKSIEPSKEEAAMVHIEHQVAIERNIRALCYEADPGDTGYITKDDWQHVVKRGGMEGYLDLVGLKSRHVAEYFDALAELSADGKVEIEAFVNGCMHMKGSPLRFDIMSVAEGVTGLSKMLHAQQRDIRLLLARLPSKS